MKKYLERRTILLVEELCLQEKNMEDRVGFKRVHILLITYSLICKHYKKELNV